jgi:FkbM family methyltransferase
MLNGKIGDRRDINGLAHAYVPRGESGFCLYGPYERRDPGLYHVDYRIQLAEELHGKDQVCAILDVATDSGQRILAQRAVLASELSGAHASVRLHFEVPETLTLEYRAYAVGTVALLIADQADVVPASALPAQADAPILEWDGIRIHASTWDDVRFLEEIFFKHTYRVLSQADLCCIDVGMNVGLTSLMFAKMSNVRTVHAFEPFPETYQRGLANFALNPELAAKIVPHNFGLAARDETVTVRLNNQRFISGSANLFEQAGDHEVELAVRDAAAVLGPIVAEARSRGQQIVVKVDCEGSEFAVFETLTQTGLLGSVDAFAVEWHRAFPGRNQSELIAPLLAAGFIVVDLSPEHGNGFFYAVRTDRDNRRPTPTEADSTLWNKLRKAIPIAWSAREPQAG